MSFPVEELQIKVIPSKIARQYITRHHYMKTFPNSVVSFGVFYGKKLSGCLSFGFSTSTKEKIKKIVPYIGDNEFLEMQRMHLLDTLGMNSESYVIGQVMSLLREKGLKAVITHAGGCKYDCGIVYQASSWLYFGKEPCADFYKTVNGEYKNIVAPMRFGRVPKGIKGAENIGQYLFGDGELIESYRYLYIYPLQKGLRKWLEKKALPYPKDSKRFRREGEWIENDDYEHGAEQ